MFWTDNMCIPLYASNPKDAMTLMDFFYDPQVQAVVEYYNDYVCPVPAAKQELLHPTGWAQQALAETASGDRAAHVGDGKRAHGLPDRGVRQELSRNYTPLSDPEALKAWNSIFLPITQGA